MIKHKNFPRLALSRLDGVAIMFALLLSLACLIRGAVDDTMVALLLIALLPILYLALTTAHTVHAALKTIGIAWFAWFGLVLCLQQFVPYMGNNEALWQEVHQLSGEKSHLGIIYSQTAWLQGVGRALLLATVFAIALLIGASESSARLFLQALLISGSIAVATTFFTLNREGEPTTFFAPFTHGFVNANNAATYMGVLLLLALAQGTRLIRQPTASGYKSPLDFIDQLTITLLARIGVVVFSLLLALAGLLMTGSRGGILASIISAACLIVMLLLKTHVSARARAAIMVAAMLAIAALLSWSFFNYGQTITQKLDFNGTSSNDRTDIISAVIPMIGDYPLLGVGLGGFADLFQQYRPQTISADGIIDKAHNSYLEFAAEMGLPTMLILMLLLGAMGYQLFRGFRQREARYTTPALGFAVWLLAALHSLIDFPLQIPGIAALFIAITTVCVSQTDRELSQPATPTSTTPVKRHRIRKRRSSATPSPAH